MWQRKMLAIPLLGSFYVSQRILFLGLSHLILSESSWLLLWNSLSPSLSTPDIILGGALSLRDYLLDRVPFQLTHVWLFKVLALLLVLEYLEILKVQDVLNVTSSFLWHAKLL